VSSPQLKKVIAHLRELARKTYAALELPPEQRLPEMRRLLNDYGRVDRSVDEVAAEVRPLVVGGRDCEWLLPDDFDPARRMLYIHGGSWMKGSLDSHRSLAARIARATKCCVLAVDYRLAPEDPFPAGLEDCITAFRWLLDNAPTGPGESRFTLIAGDSAGGNLALASLLSLRDRGAPLPDGAIVMSPATDFLCRGESMQTRAGVDPLLTADSVPKCAAVYLRHGEDLADPLVSPLYGDLAGLPPLLIQVGDAEVLLDDSRRLADKAREAGVEVTLEVWPEMPHVFQAFAPYLPEAVEAIEHMAAFVRSLSHP
jgi:monoterpene epsilon-lactone hydrolase